MNYHYQRYIRRVTRQPWCILPSKFEVIADLMRERASGYRPSDEELAAPLEGEDDRRLSVGRSRSGAVAIIPVHGIIAHRADAFEASSGGTSTELISALLSRAVSDDEVTSILLDFSTPGGSVEGVPELAAQIATAKTVKPIVAHINAQAASAGYWLASQATEVVMTPSGQVGSIGVFILLIDESKALEKDGIVVNAISAGKYKLEGAWWEPLSDGGRAHFQGQVTQVHRDFLSAVAKGRGVSVSQVQTNFGQGRVFQATEALSRGMVDRIATIGDTLMRLDARTPRSGRLMSAARP